MVVYHDKIAILLAYPRGVPLSIPGVVYVDGEVRTANRSEGCDRLFVPRLDLVVIGGLIQELQTDDVGNRSEL